MRVGKSSSVVRQVVRLRCSILFLVLIILPPRSSSSKPGQAVVHVRALVLLSFAFVDTCSFRFVFVTHEQAKCSHSIRLVVTHALNENRKRQIHS